jgi:hypothetical protein
MDPSTGAARATRTESVELPTCKCGTDRDSKFAVCEREYGALAILYLVWGGTSVPKKVSWRCVKCGQVFDSSTREVICRRYIK